MKKLLKAVASVLFPLALLMQLGASQTAQAEIITTFAGTSAGNSGDGGPASAAQLSQPTALVFDSGGNLYVADSNNHRVRKISPSGIITNVAGTTQGFGGDGGPATSASLNSPYGLALDGLGNLYIADTANQRIRKVNTSGIITTVAGSGLLGGGSAGDGGLAVDARFNNPTAVAVDAAGLLYIVDQANGRIRRVAANGIISNFAGIEGHGFGGDGGPATSAQFNQLGYIGFNGSSLYIADTGNGRIRRISGGNITTVAGGGSTLGEGGPATSASINSPIGLAFEPSGRLFISDRNNHLIRTFTVGGNINSSAGTGTIGFGGDGGAGIAALLNSPHGVARGPDGYIYFADTGNHRIRRLKLAPNPPVITNIERLVGNFRVHFTPTVNGGYQAITNFTATCGDKTASGTSSGFILGPLTAGTPYVCTVIATNATGASVASAPWAPTKPAVNNIVTVTAPASSITGQAVTIDAAVTGDEPVIGTVRFHYNGTTITGCEAVALTPTSFGAGSASCTTSLLPVGGLTLFAAFTGGNPGNAGGTGSQSHTVAPRQPQFITFAAPTAQLTNAGIVTVTATGGGSGNPVAFVSLTGNICVHTGANGADIKLTGLAGTCTLRASQAGTVSYFAAGNVDRSFAVTAALTNVPLIATVAGGVPGSYTFDPDGGFGALTHFAGPVGVAADGAGNVYIADGPANRVRKVALDGVVTTIAGNGIAGFSGDGGPAVDAKFNYPTHLALDASSLYISDAGNMRIRKVTLSTGIVTTVAGSMDVGGYGGDGGPATSARLNYPYGLAIDGAGNLYIADQNNHRIRQVTPAGIISTYAGTGSQESGGDGGPATSASLYVPSSIGLDSAGNLYIGEVFGRRIRKVTPAGIISTIAGTGAQVLSGDGGSALAAALNRPYGLAVDGPGNVYFTEYWAGQVRKISTSGLISTVAGGSSFIADGGDARASNLSYPEAVAVDSAGNLYIADWGNQRVRKVTFNAPMAPAAPTITGATPGNGTITLAFTANYDGNAAIIDFTVICTHLGTNVTAIGAAPPVMVTGLVNGTGYTCTVRARNAQGNSATSAPFGPVTPIPDIVSRRSDMTGNGTSDVIWYHTGVFGLIGMNANGLSLDPYYIVDIQTDANWKVAGIGDLNGDGRADVVWRNAATGQVYGLLMEGGTVLSEAVIYNEANLDWKVEQVADVNGDGKADLIWKNQATGDVYIMIMNGLTTTGGQIVYTEPNLDWKIMASGDMNGDGRADLLWRNVATGDVFSMLMDGFTVLSGGVIYTEPNLSWKIIGLADYNGDGRSDVLWQNATTGDVFEMQMNGTVVSAGQVIYNEPNTQWKIVALGDYNGDGKADLLWQNLVTGQVYMMLMDGFTITGANFVYTETDTQWQIVGP